MIFLVIQKNLDKINTLFLRYTFMMTTHKDGHLLISVVTPVYNGERFVRQAYECLCRQTCNLWEWVVVDDGSTDCSRSILEELCRKDSRVSFYCQPNSGAAKYPRDRAVAMSKGEFILQFDMDDNLSDDYLQTLLDRLVETEADIVYPRMVFVNTESGQVTQTLPMQSIDTTKVYVGRDLVKHTVPEWEIGCNGGLYRRQAWLNLSYPPPDEPLKVTSDEVDERLYQIHARRVAFAQASYFYRNHSESLTQRVSARFFLYLFTTHLQLADVIEEHFGHDSEEFRRVNLRLLSGWRTLAACYLHNYRRLTEEESMILRYLQLMFDRIDPALLSTGLRMKFLNLCNHKLLLTLFSLKYAPSLLPKKFLARLWPSAYRWTVIRHRTEQAVRQAIATVYADGHASAGQCPPYVISLFCGLAPSGGLVDRLRGSVSIYQLCQQTGRPFKLHFTHPFPLTDYLLPNTYDWRLGEGELSFNQTATLICDTQTRTSWEQRYQRRKLTKRLKATRQCQLHCYTNSPLCYEHQFSTSWNELFRPSPRLETSLKALRRDIGGGYITVSARFCNLLADFKEEVFNEPLEPGDRRLLVDQCLEQTRQIALRHPDCRLVVCADSPTFLRQASDKLGAYVIPGTVTHIGNDATHDYNYYEKTFLDFFTVAGAGHAYLLLGPRMLQSGFPYAAALSQERPYDIVSF